MYIIKVPSTTASLQSLYLCICISIDTDFDYFCYNAFELSSRSITLSDKSLETAHPIEAFVTLDHF